LVLIDCIAKRTDKYSDISIGLRASETDRARATVFGAANQLSHPQLAFSSVINESPSATFAAYMLLYLRERHRNRIFELWDSVNVDELQAQLAERIRINPNRLKTESRPAGVLRICGRDTADVVVVASLLANGTDSELILSWFADRNHQGTQVIDFGFVSEVLDVDSLARELPAEPGPYGVSLRSAMTLVAADAVETHPARVGDRLDATAAGPDTDLNGPEPDD
jgi:hypothetical protein